MTQAHEYVVALYIVLLGIASSSAPQRRATPITTGGREADRRLDSLGFAIDSATIYIGNVSNVNAVSLLA
jgi:hypothetical protein